MLSKNAADDNKSALNVNQLKSFSDVSPSASVECETFADDSIDSSAGEFDVHVKVDKSIRKPYRYLYHVKDQDGKFVWARGKNRELAQHYGLDPLEATSKSILAAYYGISEKNISTLHAIHRYIIQKNATIPGVFYSLRLLDHLPDSPDKERISQWFYNKVSRDKIVEARHYKPPQVMVVTDFSCLVDPDEARAAHIAGNLQAYHLWCIAHQLDKDIHAKKNPDTNELQGATGWVEITELIERLVKMGIYKRSTFSDWIRQGESAGYWRIHRDGCQLKRLYYTAQTKLSIRILESLSVDDLEGFTKTDNLGGANRIYIDMACSIGEFRARCFDAWLHKRSTGSKGIMIGNPECAHLWKVSDRTLRNWRKRAGTVVEENYAVAQIDAHVEVPEHAVMHGKKQIKWQMVNTYHASNQTRKHNHTGKRRYVREIAKSYMQEIGLNPGDQITAREMKLYFDASKRDSKRLERLQYSSKQATVYQQVMKRRRGPDLYSPRELGVKCA